ncbi:MAG: site-specific integrase [Bdellovibrionales bacterium]|nr:site-specific integrase [Bdellovibrionales bacterium]
MGIIKRRYRKKNQQKENVYYRAEVYVKGVRVSARTFSTKREAVFWHEQEKHKFTLSPSSLNDRITFKDCVERFWKDAKARMMKSTIQSYECRLTYFYKGPLADIKMSSLKGIHILEWIEWLKKHPTAKNKGRKSFIQEVNFLRTILYWYRNFLNEDFNVPITKKHRQMSFFKPIIPRRPDHYMRPEDGRQWVEWLKERRSNPVYFRLAVFMLLTGTRVGEACGLKWEEVDLEKGTARIIRRVRWDQQTKRPFLEDVTKTVQSARLLMLPEKLKDVFKEMKKEAVNGLVFTDAKGELLKYNAIQSSFNAGFEALNLPWRSTHICRHTFATIALMETKNLSAVQASLGHTEIRMTQRYAKTVALLSSETGEKTASAIFKDSRL